MPSATNLRQHSAHRDSHEEEVNLGENYTSASHDDDVFVLVPRLTVPQSGTEYPDHSEAWLTSSFIRPLTPANTTALGPERTQEASHNIYSMPTTVAPTIASGTGGPEPESTNHPATTLPAGVIAAITTGGLFAAAIGILAIWICFRRRQSRTLDRDMTPPMRPEDTPIRMEMILQEDRIPTPRSDFWLENDEFWDPRDASSTGVRSPTPKPAVAEVRSYTRAPQRPRVCDIGKPSAQWPGPGAPSGSPRSATAPGLLTYTAVTLPPERTQRLQRASCHGRSFRDHQDIV